MKLMSLLAATLVISVWTVQSARAAETLPIGPKKWYRPSKADLEVDSTWDRLGEDKYLPERVRGKMEAASLLAQPSENPLAGTSEDAGTVWTPQVSLPFWVVPSSGLGPEIQPMASNNNVAITQFEGRLFMAWRTAPIHFASPKTRMYIVSSTDMGHTWEFEHEIVLGSDMREPCFLPFQGRLIFSFFQAGTNPIAFEPKHLLRIERLAQGQWTQPEEWGEDGEIAWEIKARNGRAWATSYKGSHYTPGRAAIEVHFKVTDDGTHWRNVDESHPTVYSGGVSEAGWEFDSKGELWAVLRNEDCDQSGCGALLAHAPASDLAHWEVPAKSDPYRYDSPRMFRHGEDIYMVARRNVDGRFDKGWSWLTFDLRKWLYWIRYSFTPKRTALYQIDRENRRVVWLQDLPGDGDTAFPSILQTGPDSWLVANYTSPLRYPKRTWIWGQVSPEGTQLYFTEITFKKTAP